VLPTIGAPTANPALTDAIHAAPDRTADDDLGLVGSMVRSAKEIIFRTEADGIHLNFVIFSIDAAKGVLSIANTFEMSGLRTTKKPS
jgi:hypothetical protein